MPTRTVVGSPLCGILTVFAQRSSACSRVQGAHGARRLAAANDNMLCNTCVTVQSTVAQQLNFVEVPELQEAECLLDVLFAGRTLVAAKQACGNALAFLSSPWRRP